MRVSALRGEALAIVLSLLACGFCFLSGPRIAHAAPITHEVMIQPVQVCDDGGANCAQTGFFEPETDKIWAQAGIDISFLPTVQLNSTANLVVDPGSVPELTALWAAGNAVAGNPTETMAINMYFVDDTPGAFGLGCGNPIFQAFCGNGANGIGVIIEAGVFSFNGGIGRLDTIAHEIGHVLGLGHNTFGANVNTNFMATGGGFRLVPGTIDDIAPDGANLDQMNQAQIDEVFDNEFGSMFVKEIQQVPEPSVLVMLGLGLVGLYIVTRRRLSGA